MALQITRLSGPLGAEILGVDLNEEVSGETADALRQAVLDHLLIVLRDQHVEPADHRRFCELFGEIQPQRLAAELESKDYVGMMFVGNARQDAMLRNGEMWLHSDQCYYEAPNNFTSLQAITVTRTGGNTRFANCHLAYKDLPEDEKARLEGLRGMNVYDYNERNQHKKTAPRDPDSPRFAHPLVRTHPRTGRKSLYLNRLMTDYILDMDETLSRQWLDRLHDQVEDERFIYEHRWREGDLAIWDNRCVLHGRTDFDPAEPRLLRRFCVVGEAPY